MTQRTRTRTGQRSAGKLERRASPVWDVYGPWPYQSRYEKVVDHYDKKKRPDGTTPPTGLYIFKEYYQPLFLDYKAISSVDGIVYDRASSLPALSWGVGENWVDAGMWASIEPSQDWLKARLLASSNPFRYEVSIPVMVAELIEASTLLKIGVNNLFQAIGSQHLNYTFGWKQMKSDIRKLASITTAIESRIREFNSLVSKGGLRRLVKLGKYKGAWPADGTPALGTVWSTHGIYASAEVRTTYTSEIWGTVRWKPQRGKEIEIKALAAFNKAALIVLDIDELPGASSIWEMIPFTWLVDYFVNIGPTLQAIEKSDLVVPTDICIMRHRNVSTSNLLVQKSFDDGTWTRQWRGSGGHNRQEFKLRDVEEAEGIGDLLSFGFMSDGQKLNLLALIMSMTRYKMPGQFK